MSIFTKLRELLSRSTAAPAEREWTHHKMRRFAYDAAERALAARFAKHDVIVSAMPAARPEAASVESVPVLELQRSVETAPASRPNRPYRAWYPIIEAYVADRKTSKRCEIMRAG